jgi:glycosyltransferase involved in cell wall biosynthesis
LASGTPIVASSIPALRDWLSKDEVRFVEPDDAGAMTTGILEVLSDPVYAENLSRRGLEKVMSFSYERRAQEILARLAC